MQPVETQSIVEMTETPMTDPSPTPTIENTAIAHAITPGEPGYITKWFYDTNAGNSASSGGVTGGDDYVANLYERPFTESDMIYRPDLDIIKTEITSDSNFIYTNIILNGENPDGGLPGIYGIEIDWDRNGRGDLLVTAQNPITNDWSIEGVSVFKDANHDVGGASIMRPDSSYSGDSYETVLLSSDIIDDPDLAWARYTPGNSPTVTLAFKKTLIEGGGTFVWGVWAAESLLTPDNLDLHDHITQADAGSPYPSHSDYPLAALNLVDNTCRETYGFDATSPIPGLCYIPEQPTPEPTSTPTERPTSAPIPGTITGVAFDDYNNNSARDAGEPETVYSVTITIHQDSCSNPPINSTTAKTFSFSGLTPGAYCVKISGGGPLNNANPQNVNISSGGTAYILFAFESPE